MLDTVRHIETPEGVVLELRAAGPVVRLLAWLIDFSIQGLVFVALSIALMPLGDVGVGLFLLALFVIQWWYPVLFEIFNHGQTPGKRALRIAVTHDDGTPVGRQASILRNLLLAADFLPFFYLGAMLSMVASPEFRRLGDRAAGTTVVYRDRVRWSEAPARAPALAVPLALSIAEQRVLIEFAERSPSWTPERKAELADLISDLAGARGDEAVARLHGMAQRLLGRA